MKLIVGLGNPGPEYEGTRHNVGWRVVEALQQAMMNDKFIHANQAAGAKFQFHSKFQAELLKIDDLVLMKPKTYMNRSGEAVLKVVTYYQIVTDNIWVAHDDLDINLGEYKISQRGPKIHNGVNSVEEALGRDDFWRVRVGVDNRHGDRSKPGQAYVLDRFTSQEREEIKRVIEQLLHDLTRRFDL
jgi:peptidyl-tRNA hydrolase, PTH1 family